MGAKVIDYQFKLLYALGIILVVAGHCRNGGVSLFYDWFHPYAFHLKLFMFASGYFFSEHNEYCPVRFIWKKFKRLIIPYFLWNLVYGIFTMITKYYGGFTIGANISLKNLFVIPLQSGAPFAYNMGGWFLIPLFIVHIYNLFMRIVIKKFFGGVSTNIGCLLLT